MLSMNDIPIEIIEHIIDLLHDDVQALAACSLVCHGWKTRARCNLFLGLTLDLKAESQSLNDSDAIASFQRSLNSLPLFTIQRLEIVGDEVPPAVFLWPFWSRLKNVTRLHLDNFDFPDSDLPPVIDQLSTLECLSLENVFSLSVTSLLRILETAQNLSELRLTATSWFSSNDTEEDNLHLHLPRPSIPLRHITLNEVQSLEWFVDIIVERYPDLPLQSLWTHHIGSDRILLKRFCASLCTLDLRFHDAAFFDMTGYKSLHTLVLPEVSHGSIRDGFLKSITSTSFTNIVLFLNNGDPTELVSSNRDTFDWAHIDNDMTTFHPSVNVIVSSKEFEAMTSTLTKTQSYLMTKLAAHLPLCMERGVVSFYPCDPQMWRELHINSDPNY